MPGPQYETTTSQYDAYANLPESVDYLIEHPIHCGYLLAFCESQYSAENLHYLMEIDRFKDHFTQDTTAWNGSNWRQIDRNVGIVAGEVVTYSNKSDLHFGDEKDWPSNIVPRIAVIAHIQSIWDTFLSDKAPTQICVPSKVLHNTKRRLELLHVYGKEVFGETTIDPLKTMNRDILPRFLQSDYFTTMESRMAQLTVLPTSSTLNIPLPSHSPILENSAFFSQNSSLEMLRADIPTIIHDRILYADFLTYLRSIVSSENLLFVRAIAVYHSLCHRNPNPNLTQGSSGTSQTNLYSSTTQHHNKYTSGGNSSHHHGNSSFRSNNSTMVHYLPPAKYDKPPPAAEEMAWTIYTYFIASGSAFEVSVSHRRRKEIMQGLAKPTIGLFDRVEKGCIMALNSHYENYLKSPGFAKLPETIRIEKTARDKKMRQAKSCFGL